LQETRRSAANIKVRTGVAGWAKFFRPGARILSLPSPTNLKRPADEPIPSAGLNTEEILKFQATQGAGAGAGVEESGAGAGGGVSAGGAGVVSGTVVVAGAAVLSAVLLQATSMSVAAERIRTLNLLFFIGIPLFPASVIPAEGDLRRCKADQAAMTALPAGITREREKG
jgi:hypothetical protein